MAWFLGIEVFCQTIYESLWEFCTSKNLQHIIFLSFLKIITITLNAVTFSWKPDLKLFVQLIQADFFMAGQIPLDRNFHICKLCDMKTFLNIGKIKNYLVQGQAYMTDVQHLDLICFFKVLRFWSKMFRSFDTWRRMYLVLNFSRSFSNYLMTSSLVRKYLYTT